MRISDWSSDVCSSDLTVGLSVGGMVFGLVLGFGLALMRLSPVQVLQWIARVYVSFIRGTPLLVQLFVIYYGLAQFGLRLYPIPSALIGFTLNFGGYTAEILRAPIASTERGQWWPASSIGIPTPPAMLRVNLPQAAERHNEFEEKRESARDRNG